MKCPNKYLTALSVAIVLALGFGSGAQATPLKLDVSAFTVGWNGFTFNIPTFTASANLSDGGTWKFSTPFTLSAPTSQSGARSEGSAWNFMATRSVTLSSGSVSASPQALSQSGALSYTRRGVDGGGPSNPTLFGTYASLTNSTPLTFVFSGLGTFKVNFGGGSAQSYCETYPIDPTCPGDLSSASSTLPGSVVFNAASNVAAVPEPPILPLFGFGVGLLVLCLFLRRSRANTHNL